MFIYLCACSSYLNKRFRFKTVISRSLPSFNSAHGGTRGGRHAFFSKTSSYYLFYLFESLLKGKKTHPTVTHFNYQHPNKHHIHELNNFINSRKCINSRKFINSNNSRFLGVYIAIGSARHVKHVKHEDHEINEINENHNVASSIRAGSARLTEQRHVGSA